MKLPFKTILNKTLMCAFAFPAAVSGSLLAQSPVLEEVIVTANKREQSLQDVGTAVTAFSGSQIKALRLDAMGDIAEFAPNVEFKRIWGSKGNASLFFVRGIGQADFNEASESPTTVYVDDFYVLSNSATDFLMHDVSSTEILKGPQGTLFGRNSTAGAVNIRNNRPDHDGLAGDLALSLGDFSAVEVDGAINIPLIEDKLAARFAVNYDKHDALTENLYDGPGPGAEDIHEGKFTSIRSMIQWDPTEKLSVYYKYQFGEVDAVTLGDNSLPLVQVVGETILADTDAFGYNEDLFGAGSPATVISDGKNGVTNEVDHHLLNVKFDINDEISLSSITGYFDQFKETFEDCDGTPRSICNLITFVDQDYWTQELRLIINKDRARWTLGGYYMSLDYENDWVLPLVSGTTLNGGTPGGIVQITPNTLDMTNFSAYADVAYDVTDRLTVQAGIRWNTEEKDFMQSDTLYTHDAPDTGTYTLTALDGTSETFSIFAPDAQGFEDLVANHLTGQADPTVTFADVYDDDFVNWKLQAEYSIDDDWLIYSSIKRGVKSGGFVNGLANYTAAAINEIPFSREENTAFEVGSKWESDNGKVRLNTSAYYYSLKDFQATSFSTTGSGLGIAVVNRDAQAYGGELEASFSPVESLLIVANLGLMDTTVEDITNVGAAGSTVTRDREMGHAPDYQGSIMLRHQYDSSQGSFVNQLNATFIGKRFVDVLNDPGTQLPSYTKLDYSLTYRPDQEDSWYVTGFAKNLLNDRTRFQQFNFASLAGTGQVNYLPRRRVGVEFGISF